MAGYYKDQICEILGIEDYVNDSKFNTYLKSIRDSNPEIDKLRSESKPFSFSLALT